MGGRGGKVVLHRKCATAAQRPPSPSGPVTFGLRTGRGPSSLEVTMRSQTLTFVFAILGPLSLGSVACFLSTEGDGYDYETYGSGGDCEVGSEGCDCTSGGSCNPGFKCDTNQNICFLDECTVGTEGCAGTPAGACDPIPARLGGACGRGL